MIPEKTVCELCCGPGGMALGFSQHFNIVHAVDIKPEVVSTYSANHPETDVRRHDIRLLTGCRGDFDGMTGIIGGPPCQGSSIINTDRDRKWKGAVDLNLQPIQDDPRNGLMNEFIRLVTEIQPQFFVMENVPGVKSEKKIEVIADGEKAGYNVTSVYLNAAVYGAAQTRKRWIVIGLKGKTWTQPLPGKAKTLRQALAPLRENWGKMQSGSAVLEYLRSAHTGEWQAMSGTFKNMIKLEWDRPTPAIVNLKKVYMVHPDECRNISLAEAAALQGFPTSYIWKGNESQIAQMIANAMPAELARAIAGSLA